MAALCWADRSIPSKYPSFVYIQKTLNNQSTVWFRYNLIQLRESSLQSRKDLVLKTDIESKFWNSLALGKSLNFTLDKVGML